MLADCKELTEDYVGNVIDYLHGFGSAWYRRDFFFFLFSVNFERRQE